jgi:hypothetical protein
MYNIVTNPTCGGCIKPSGAYKNCVNNGGVK